MSGRWKEGWGKGESNRRCNDTKSTKVGKVTSKTNRHTALLVGVLNPQWRLRTEGLYLHLIIPEFLNACPVQFFTAHKHLVTSSSSSILVFPPTSHQTSAISLNRRIVLLVAAAAGVLYKRTDQQHQPPFHSSAVPPNHSQRSPILQEAEKASPLTKPSTPHPQPSSCSLHNSRCRRCAS